MPLFSNIGIAAKIAEGGMGLLAILDPTRTISLCGEIFISI